MTSHYRWYPAAEDVIVPWNATYEFPSQANKAVKITPRLPPKNGAVFRPGNVIRLEFPAQGFVHPGHTTLEFDVVLKGMVNAAGQNWSVWFQNNIQSIFSRARLLYGSTPIEDINDADFITRSLTEFTSGPDNVMDQKSISEGIGGAVQRAPYTENVRRATHSINVKAGVLSGRPNYYTDTDGLFVATKRYQIQLPFGMFNQGKLIPTKFMASQFVIEYTLNQPEGCIMMNTRTKPEPPTAFPASAPPSGTPTFYLQNVNLIPEILEFDASYDADFLMGLKTNGVPIQFATWHNYTGNITGQNMQMIIQERSRSTKAIYAFAVIQQKSFQLDSGASFGDLQLSLIESYQYRIGGRYFPAAPVECNSPGLKTGSCEAFIELQKALGTLGDNRLSSFASLKNWNAPNAYNNNPFALVGAGAEMPSVFGADDYQYDCINAYSTNGTLSSAVFGLSYPTDPNARAVIAASGLGLGGSTSKPSSVFCMAINLETTNGREVSGLNAEEQSDISLIIKYQSAIPVVSGLTYELKVFTYIDQLMILRENNQVELVL